MASSAISIKPNNYDGYYARAKALMDANSLEEALLDTQNAQDKVRLQQKYQKISTEVKETLARLAEELSKRVSTESYQSTGERSYRHHAETTDL